MRYRRWRGDTGLFGLIYNSHTGGTAGDEPFHDSDASR